MYKIKYLPTGHVFLLPGAVAMELKNKNPFDYQILEKDGKKIKDKIQVESKTPNPKSILLQVLDEEIPKAKGRKKK